MAERAHSILGASSSARWLACPGSIRLSAGLPKTSTSYADEGTAAHELAETCLRTKTHAKDHLGSLITINGSVYEVDDEMAEAVQVYLDNVRVELGEAGKTASFEIEKRFHLDWLYPGLFGTCDAVIGQPFGKCTVVDFKYGAGVAVEVTDNPQLKYYAAGATCGETYEEVELVIVQPRAQHPEGPVRRWKISTEDLNQWCQDVLLPGAQATEDPRATLCPGNHCRFCPALAICPAQKEKAFAVAKAAFAKAQPPAPEAMTFAELRKVLDAADLVEAWLAACRVHVKMALESGMATPEEVGYKMVAGRASRRWIDEDEALAAMEMLAIDPYEKRVKSPAQAEKLAKKGAFDSLITTSRGTQLVPLSDKREALRPAALTFEEVNRD